MPAPLAVTVWFNPRCSKCRKARELLAFLGLSDPAEMMRTQEAAWTELGLEDAGADARLPRLVTRRRALQRTGPIRNLSGTGPKRRES